MRIVALSPSLPYPGACHAGADFLLAHLEALGATNDITLFGLALPEAERAQELVSGKLHLSGLLPYPPPTTRPAIARLGSLFMSLLGWELLDVVGCDLPAMLAPATEHLQAADIIEVHWAGWLAPLIPLIKRIAPNAVLAAVHLDVPWEAAARRSGLRKAVGNGEAVSSGRNRLSRGASQFSFAAFREVQAHLLGCADVALVLTERDRSLIRRAGISCPVLVRDPPLDLPEPDDTRERVARPPGRTVLFTGALGRPENHRSIAWFLERVWPLVQASCKDAYFVVAGAEPPEELRSRASATVSITGQVTSLTPFYRAADVFVAPLLVGSGLKLKVPQAMLHGLPVVATPIAAEGIIEEGGSRVFATVTDDPDAMARCLAEMLTMPELARSQGERGRQWAAGHYDFAAGTDRVVGLYEELVQAQRSRPVTALVDPCLDEAQP